MMKKKENESLLLLSLYVTSVLFFLYSRYKPYLRDLSITFLLSCTISLYISELEFYQKKMKTINEMKRKSWNSNS